MDARSQPRGARNKYQRAGIHTRSNPLSTGQARRRRLHHHLAFALAEGIGEALLVVLAEDIGEPRLPPVLVYTLGDLVPRGVTKTGE